jgi:Myb-like DNA-binding domain
MEGFDVEKIQDALAANRALQCTIQAELRRLRDTKRDNRLRAAALVEQVLSTQKKQSAGPSMTVPAVEKSTSSQWKHRFFEDDNAEDGTNIAPALYDNSAAPAGGIRRSDFYRRLRPPWTTKESKQLVKTVKSAVAAKFAVDELYDRVASALKPPLPGNTNGGVLRRTPEECRIEYIRQCERPLTKIEIQKLESFVAATAESSTTAGGGGGGGEEVDWIATADQMSVGRAVPCSPFQCLAAWKKKIENGRSKKRKSTTATTTWTPAEDQLLLKFMLAAGPQLLLDTNHPFLVQRGSLCQELLPDKTKRQILDRIHSSSLNPKLAEGDWTDDEERKLTILMKVYGGDLLAASTHLARAPKAVSDKWQRTLNPEYLTGPFSKDDDARLVLMIRSQPELGWRDIARQHFPQRHPQRLMNRWLELATDQDLIAREQITRKRSRQQKTNKF